MRISIITLFPAMLDGFLNSSIVKRAQEKQVVTIEVINLRDFAIDAYGTVDDHVYGGGAGMLLRVDVLSSALSAVKKKGNLASTPHVVLTSARGENYTQKIAQKYAKMKHLIVIAGHYEGIDERVLQMVDEEVSIGDFVLTGGELPAAVLVDSVVRLLPGVLEKETATKEESFGKVTLEELKRAGIKDKSIEELERKGVKTVQLLEYPHYTRPQEFDKHKVPTTLLSGDHKKITAWRLREAFAITKKRRPDLLV